MTDPLAHRLPLRLTPQPSRVVARLFVPGHTLVLAGVGKPSRIVEAVLALADADVDAVLDEVLGRFEGRHRDLDATLGGHADRLAERLGVQVELSPKRRLLLGATFTSELAIEAAALCNPSAVLAPDQSGLAPGAVRFILSVRQISEGHRSSIGFRSGVLDADGDVTIDDAGDYTTTGNVSEAPLRAEALRAGAHSDDGEAIEWVLGNLPAWFTSGELAARMHELDAQPGTAGEVVSRVNQLAARHYCVEFPPSSSLAERVLVPAMAAEANGLEDARFVRLVETDGTVTFHATYTAYDGTGISQQLLTTTDFASFMSTPMLGKVATDKGLALFPRRVGGRFHALTRFDGATNAVATSNDLGIWGESTPLAAGTAPWELVQVGNCGPPIELDEGWLVITHGVGPMRTYSLGALLLDLDDPSVVVGRLRHPLLTPQPDEREGYVPNVVYSCGSLRSGDVLLVPYGIGDMNVGFATFSIDEVLAAMEPPQPRRP